MNMQEIVISGGAVPGYGIAAAVNLALPVLAFLWLRRYGSARLYPVIVGALTYFLTTQFCDLTVRILLFSAPAAQKSIAATELIALFEETGRWLAMLYPLCNIRHTRDAVCCGIGHGGLACWIHGAQSFQVIGHLRRLSAEGLASFTDGQTPERAAETVRLLQTYAENGFFYSLLDVLIEAADFGMHIALSLLIFSKMDEEHFKRRWLLLAIGLHYAVNVAGWLASLSHILLLRKTVSLAAGAGVILLVSKFVNMRAVLDELQYPVTDEDLLTE